MRPYGVIILAGGILLAGAALAQDADPLAPGREGKLRCYDPDAATHGCSAISYFTWGDGDEVLDVTEMVLTLPDRVIMHVETPVTVVGEALCEPYRPEDMAAASFVENGAPADEARSEELRRIIAERLPAPGSVMCTTAVAEGDRFRNAVTLDGEPGPPSRSTWIWVDAGEGWEVK